MSRNRTAEEVKQHHIDKMGKELGTIFNALWNEYVELFGTKPSRIDLLNRSAPIFFKVVEQTLWKDILLHITRITAPEKSMGKDILTVQRLPNLVEVEIKQDIVNLIDNVKENTEFCKDWRNRRIAHSDLDLSIKEGAEPLKPASRNKVEEALKSISNVLNAVEHYYLNSTTIYEKPPYSGGVIDLLYIINDGLRADEQRRKRVKEGNSSEDDYTALDL